MWQDGELRAMRATGPLLTLDPAGSFYSRELPLEPFRYYRYGERSVNLDGCVEVEAAYYGAPPGWIGRKVNVHWDGLHVRLIDPKTGVLLREHRPRWNAPRARSFSRAARGRRRAR